jgi:protein-S-isoprenylcysteine O-methyltransferase Ste14/glycosyltransferase involved in cell wall biosynthesis
MQTLFLLSASVAVLSAGMFVLFEIAVAFTGKVRPLKDGEFSGVPARISVVIPARNEEEDIEEALRSVLGQKGVELHVIVVNDHSTDRTGTILRRLAEEDSRLTIVESPPLAAGWLGKPNAMNHGVALAADELILFTDADVVHCPTSLATGISILQREGLDFLSFTARIDCESFWENVFIPLSLFPLTANFARGLRDPHSPEAWAAGAFMLIKADVLQNISGISSIKSAILDDTELARVVKRSGHRVGYHLGPHLMHVRMFKSNRHAFWGPTKNAIALSFQHPWMAIPAMGLPALFFWVPIAAALVGFWTNDARLFAVGAFQPLAALWGLVRIRPFCKFRWVKAVFFPLIVIPIVCVLARAFYEQHIRGQHVWRDRAIDLADAGCPASRLTSGGIRYIVQRLGLLVLFAALLLLAAGSWNWPRGWIYILATWTVESGMLLLLAARAPEMLNHRGAAHGDLTAFDKVFAGLWLLAGFASAVIAGIDAVRFRWSSLPGEAVIAGLIVLLVAAGLGTWAMLENEHFEQFFRIQSDRDHRVVSTGPYAFIRHPGYLAAILGGLSAPLILGSCWMFVPVGLGVVLFAVRASLEDQLLQKELEGYSEYVDKTRYLLVPFLW